MQVATNCDQLIPNSYIAINLEFGKYVSIKIHIPNQPATPTINFQNKPLINNCHAIIIIANKNNPNITYSLPFNNELMVNADICVMLCNLHNYIALCTTRSYHRNIVIFIK